VLLAGRGLWIHLRDHRLDLAELAGELGGTLAGVLIDPVHAGAPVLAHVVHAIVHIHRAVVPAEKYLNFFYMHNGILSFSASSSLKNKIKYYSV